MVVFGSGVIGLNPFAGKSIIVIETYQDLLAKSI